MKCPKCGKEIADDSKFCEFCGARVSKPRNRKPIRIVLIIIGLSALSIGSFCAYRQYKRHVMEVAAENAMREDARKREEEAIRAEELRREEQARLEEERKLHEIREAKKKELIREGYVDLDLPSGTLWKKKPTDIYNGSYKRAIEKYGDQIPSREQWLELIDNCKWKWYAYEKNVQSVGEDGTKHYGFQLCQGFKVYGKNGNYIDIEASHYGIGGIREWYYSSTYNDSSIWCTQIYENEVSCSEWKGFFQDEKDKDGWWCWYFAIHLVQKL